MIIAGGGTGGVAVFFGEQLNHTNAEVVYLDFSIASMHIAQRRAHIRGIRNIIWIQDWIEGVRFLGLSLFHEFQCSGVLHHLKRPSYGLNILKDSLTRFGGMGLMVYAKYGRTAVYQTQDLLKIINSYHGDIEMEIKNAIYILKVLPVQNWFHWFILNSVGGDHKKGKVGIYDLLLHKRDVSFSIKTLFEWIRNSGLYFIDFDYYKKRYYLQTRYIISDRYLARVLSQLDRVRNMCIIELLRGDVKKQDFYASKIRNSVADIRDETNVIYLYGNPQGLRGEISNKKNHLVHENNTFFTSWMYRTNSQHLQSSFDNNVYQKHINSRIKFGWMLNRFNELLVNKMLLSKQGIKLKNVFTEYRKTLQYNISYNALSKLLYDFYENVKDTEMFLLKKQYVLPFPKTSFLNTILIKGV